MNWAQGLLDNEEIFPSEMGACVQAPTLSADGPGAVLPRVRVASCGCGTGVGYVLASER